MAMNLSISLQQQQKMVMTMQMHQAFQLLQVTGQELEDTLLEEKSLFKYKRHTSPNSETEVKLTETRIEIWFSHEDF